MIQFVVGAVIGVAGTLFYSEQVRLKVMETNIELLKMIKNKVELKREVYKEIQRMQQSGELDEFLYNKQNHPYYKGLL